MTESSSGRPSFFRKLSLSSAPAQQPVPPRPTKANKADFGPSAVPLPNAPPRPNDFLSSRAASDAYTPVKDSQDRRSAPLALPFHASLQRQSIESSTSPSGTPSSDDARPRQLIYPALASPPHSPPNNMSPPPRDAAQIRIENSVFVPPNHQSELRSTPC